jgi:hypothetical protein
MMSLSPFLNRVPLYDADQGRFMVQFTMPHDSLWSPRIIFGKVTLAMYAKL